MISDEAVPERATVEMLVMDRVGALSRVTRVVAHQRANIEELSVTKATEDQRAVTLVVDLDRRSCELLTHKLDKLIEVVEVHLL